MTITNPPITRPAPSDLGAERAVLGAMLLSCTAVDTAARLLCAEDFWSPAHAHIFAAVTELWLAGEPVDPATVTDVLRRSGTLEAVGGPAPVVAMQTAPPSTTAVARYARIVIDHAARRRLLRLGAELADAALALADPSELADTYRERLARLDLPTGRTDGLGLVDDVVDRPEEARAPWIIPGLVRADWRIVTVAPEGVGKSHLLHQLGVCAAQGVHALTGTRITPRRTLLIDAENPEDRIADGIRPIRERLRILVGDQYAPGRAWLWHRPGGINLRSRSDRAALEAVLARTHPELVCAGPAYKLAERRPGEGWDESARATQGVLDDMRTRHRFGLVLEDHAPQADRGVRDLRPFGSSLWLRWPELGIKLISDGDQHPPAKLKVKHWRGARLAHAWPDELHRGRPGELSWIGWWRDGWPGSANGDGQQAMAEF